MEKLTEKLFQNPGKEYRGAPFWAWNGKLEKDRLLEQMDELKEMGFGGFTIHSRIGLETEYLGKEFMDAVRLCNRAGKERDMLTYLYDEDKWPSGYGGGFVTKEKPAYRARYLLFSAHAYPDGYLDRGRPAASRLTENGELTLMERYEVTLEDGQLVSYRKLAKHESSAFMLASVPKRHGTDGHTPSACTKDEQTDGGNIWYAYEVVGESLPWFNNAPYVDTMNPEAVSCFADMVYEKYAQALGDEFDKSVRSIFTDEPQFTKYQTLDDNGEAGLPYTSGLDEAFFAMYGYHFWDVLPKLIWEQKGCGFSQEKYHYHRFVTERFASAYAGTLGAWCEKHGFSLTGHLMLEDTLESQTRCVGDVMRSYPYFQIPGIDLLADRPEYNTAKQAQSVVHQMGKPGVTSELYGVTNWDFDFKGHKRQGDWQAALGITFRVPHLAWLHMGGESKRDYPAPIDAHSPWYKKYRGMEDHFARVNTVLRRGVPKVRIAVLHPIESFWMLFGPDSRSADRRARMDRQFRTLTETLLFSLLDFDFVSEGLMGLQPAGAKDGRLQIGQMQYETLIIPPLLTIRSETLALLEQFIKTGGNIIMLGDASHLVDGAPSLQAEFLNDCRRIGFDMDALVQALEPDRLVDAQRANYLRTTELLYQMREDGETRWLFIGHGRSADAVLNDHFTQARRNEITFKVRGSWHVRLYNTLTGRIEEIAHIIKENETLIYTECYADDSFLFELIPAVGTVEEGTKSEACIGKIPERACLMETRLPSVGAFRLEEKNVLLLDQAQYRLDGESWRDAEEILKVDDAVRRRCGYRLRTDSFPQPWLSKGNQPKEHVVDLRWLIRSEIALPTVHLAVEADEDVQIWWNGQEVMPLVCGSWLDPDIRRIALGALEAGENELVLRIPFGAGTNLEWAYLEGDFGVRVAGTASIITAFPKLLGFGDITSQGLPFYGGNVVYEAQIHLPAGDMEMELRHFSGALVEACLDDGPWTNLWMEPGKLRFAGIREGMHRIRIRLYGNRFNSFGQLHNIDPDERYFGPKTWRTTGSNWCCEYRLKPVGVLAAPIIRVYEK